MIKEAYIKGFLSKLAQYGIEPKDIYGDHRLGDISEVDPYDTLGYGDTLRQGLDPDNTLGYGKNSSDDIDGYYKTTDINGFAFNPKIYSLLPTALRTLGKFAYNQYNRHRGIPSYITYQRSF